MKNESDLEKPPVLLADEELGLEEDDVEKQDADFAVDFSGGLVSVADDTNMSAFTVRSVLMGVIWAGVLAALNIIGSFRDIPLSLPTSLASIVSYPMGLFFARFLPKGILNPGPFTVKEH
ncbi:hypothetical protein HDU91_000237, partial [Kappamyces sp. JEL0680]